MKKGKNTQSSTEKLELNKDCTWLQFMDEEAFSYYPSKAEWRERLGYTLMKFTEDSRNALDIVQFCKMYKIPRQTLYDLGKKYPDIGRYLENAKIFLGCNRRIGVMKRELEKDSCYKDMHKLDPEWIEINEYHAKLKLDNNTTGNITVVMPAIEKSDMVPDRESE